jgi:hypothetical protein
MGLMLSWWLGGALLAATGCASTTMRASAASRPTDARTATAPAAQQTSALRYWYDPTVPLGRPPAESLLNANGSPRITDVAQYERFWRDLAPSLREWSADPRLRLNPNFVAALMAKESGFDPRATSMAPANGIAQLTHVADLDLQIISRAAPAFRWMSEEVRRWPRAAAVHDSAARKSRTDSLLAAGTLGARTEYLFDPRLAERAALFWLRILGTIWTEDEWPGQYGALTRARLANGGALGEQDLLALVTVSYNQGHPYVADLVQRYGRDWTRHLNAESADYLERIARYTEIFQRAAGGR